VNLKRKCLASHSGRIVTDNKLSFSELSHCNVVKRVACAWRMLYVLEYHTVDCEHGLANELAIYLRFGS